mmetsp:Transcript_14703/g.20520  ORF Transcript_14703/g.20520 Transcript_14703/m.20520 type:complete len:95 (-) Transcript_14703:25-309(-)
MVETKEKKGKKKGKTNVVNVWNLQKDENLSDHRIRFKSDEKSEFDLTTFFFCVEKLLAFFSFLFGRPVRPFLCVGFCVGFSVLAVGSSWFFWVV